MNILFVFIVTIISVSFVRSDPVPTVICGFGGSSGNVSFKLEYISDRCNGILYGANEFTVKPSDADTAAISSMTSNNLLVYMAYTYSDGLDWPSIMNSNDTSCLDAQITPMMDYVKTNKVTGVILSYLGLQEGIIPDYATKIVSIICKMKEILPSVQVGLLVSGYLAAKFPDTKVFDFTVTNDHVDFYVIDTTTAGQNCGPNTATTGGRIPFTTNDPETTSFDDIKKYTSASAMEKNKIWANLLDLVTTEKSGELQTYSAYCKRTDKSLWCGDTLQLLYEQVKFMQCIIKGIIISYMDYDDTDEACQCGRKLPIANTYIDAFENKPLICCDKLKGS